MLSLEFIFKNYVMKKAVLRDLIERIVDGVIINLINVGVKLTDRNILVSVNNSVLILLQFHTFLSCYSI